MNRFGKSELLIDFKNEELESLRHSSSTDSKPEDFKNKYKNKNTTPVENVWE